MREVPAASCARYSMTIFFASICDAVRTLIGREVEITAGLKVPADSQVAPSGERIGVSDARRHAPNGKFAAGPANPSETAANKIVRNVLRLRKLILDNSLLCGTPWFGGRGRRVGRSGFRLLEFCGAHNPCALLHYDQLVGLHIFQCIDRAAWPADFEQLDLLRFSNTEMNA